MKKKIHQENKSLKTVYIYLVIVLFIICISLTVKVFNIYQQSKFDPSHEFVLAIVQHNDVKEIVAFHPETPAISILQIQDQNLPYVTMAKNYGITTDGYIETQDTINAQSDITSFMMSSILHT